MSPDTEKLLSQITERDKMQRSAVARALRLFAKETSPNLAAGMKLALRFGGVSRMDFAKITRASISYLSRVEKGVIVAPSFDASDWLQRIADHIDTDRSVSLRAESSVPVNLEARDSRSISAGREPTVNDPLANLAGVKRGSLAGR